MNRGWPMRRRLLPLLPLAACASPEPALYRLTPVPGATRTGGGAGSIELRRIGVPGYLDRNAIVRAGAGARIEVLEGARWAEPLDTMVGRAMAENLAQRLPGRTVLSEDSALRVDGDTVVELDLRRFEATGAGVVELTAQAALRRLEGERLRDARTIRVSAPVPDAGVPGVAQGMSAALGLLADELAALLAR